MDGARRAVAGAASWPTASPCARSCTWHCVKTWRPWTSFAPPQACMAQPRWSSSATTRPAGT
eukprot:12927160-Prorocentrum_lima.AAC.1